MVRSGAAMHSACKFCGERGQASSPMAAPRQHHRQQHQPRKSSRQTRQVEAIVVRLGDAIKSACKFHGDQGDARSPMAAPRQHHKQQHQPRKSSRARQTRQVEAIMVRSGDAMNSACKFDGHRIDTRSPMAAPRHPQGSNTSPESQGGHDRLGKWRPYWFFRRSSGCLQGAATPAHKIQPGRTD